MIDIEEDNLKHAILGLVITLVEVIKDALKTQALKRMESGRLTEAEIDRLGEALWELDEAIDRIKEENGVEECVRNVRKGLDDLVDDVLDRMVNPEKWAEEVQ